MKSCFAAIVVSVLMLMLPAVQEAHAGASGDPMRDIVMDSLYGGLGGALIGAATLAFGDDSSKHEDNVKIGAGVGVILGAIYGTVQLSRGLAQIEDGILTVQFPAVQWTIDGSARKGSVWKANLLSISF